jgi:hypothetical protein
MNAEKGKQETPPNHKQQDAELVTNAHYKAEYMLGTCGTKMVEFSMPPSIACSCFLQGLFSFPDRCLPSPGNLPRHNSSTYIVCVQLNRRCPI